MKTRIIVCTSFSKVSEITYALEECDPNKHLVLKKKKDPFISFLSTKLFADYKPRFAESFSSKHHLDNEDELLLPIVINGSISPPYC